jgi:hypothetical protein
MPSSVRSSPRQREREFVTEISPCESGCPSLGRPTQFDPIAPRVLKHGVHKGRVHLPDVYTLCEQVLGRIFNVVDDYREMRSPGHVTPGLERQTTIADLKPYSGWHINGSIGPDRQTKDPRVEPLCLIEVVNFKTDVVNGFDIHCANLPKEF